MKCEGKNNGTNLGSLCLLTVAQVRFNWCKLAAVEGNEDGNPFCQQTHRFWKGKLLVDTKSWNHI